MNPIKPKQYCTVTISMDVHQALVKIARMQGFVTRQGYASRAQAVEYLLKNFQDKIA